jgi:hypothetical protein
MARADGFGERNVEGNNVICRGELEPFLALDFVEVRDALVLPPTVGLAQVEQRCTLVPV